MGRVIQVFEHEKLTLKEDNLGRKLSQPELDALYSYNDKNNNIYYTGIKHGIKFSSYVGVIQIGGLTIEILPKTDKNKATSEDEFDPWRNILLQMMAACRYIKLDSVSQANLRRRYNTLLDLYFEIFLDEVNTLLRHGLIKKYHTVSSNVNALKGRINFAKNIQKNLIHKERFYTQHQIYDYENIANQILLKGLSNLDRISNNPLIRDRVARTKLDFPEIKEVKIDHASFNRVQESRKTRPYQQALKIAKMLILNYSPDIKTGGENMLALLFDMNKLWEEYIYRMMVREKPEGMNIQPQAKQSFWENKTIKPDIVVQDENKNKTYVIDTKWKIIDQDKPGDDDLKQMYAYNMYWNAHKSMLLYPIAASSTIEESFGKYHKGRESENLCKLGFISVMDENGNLKKGIGQEVLDKIL